MLILQHKSFSDRITDVFFVVLPLSFFLPIKFYNLIIVCFILFIPILRLKPNLKNRTELWILSAPFTIFLYGFILDISDGYVLRAWSEIEHYLSFILFPCFMIFYGVTTDRARLSKISFFTCCVLAALICFAVAFNKNMTDHDRIVSNWNFQETMDFYEQNPIGLINWGFFLYTELSSPIDFHPVYLGIFYVIAIVFGYSILHRTLPIWSKILIVSGTLLLVGQVFLLSGKMPVVILFLIMAGHGIYLLIRKKGRTKYWFITMLFLLIIAMPLLFPASIYRINSGMKSIFAKNLPENDEYGNTHRMYLWKTTLKLIQEKPLSGYGLYGSRLELENEYTGKYFNSHNQYLMILLVSGVVGLLIFITCHFWFLLSAIRARDYIFLTFLLTVLLILMTENFITRHKGIVFYAFFNSLFLINTYQNSDRK